MRRPTGFKLTLAGTQIDDKQRRGLRLRTAGIRRSIMAANEDGAEMKPGEGNAALEAVYAAKTPEELAEAYRQWAATYDSETLAIGYYLPFQITAWVTRYV